MIEEQLIDDYIELFGGTGIPHGVFLPSSRKMYFSNTLATRKTYENHLKGKKGMGIVPIRKDDSCYFGAIDIDDHKQKRIEIEHGDLAEKINRLGFPLICCESKSGGAHLYTFLDKPMQAKKLKSKLSAWASALGYSDAEIFPKQDHLNGSKGNWINLPYFGNSRKAYYKGGVLDLENFIALAKKVREKAAQLEIVNPLPDGPPCLAHLMRVGVPQGHRNNTLFMFSVFYKKKYPNGWEDKVQGANNQYLSPPLKYSEVNAVIKSKDKKNYDKYKCKEAPFKSFCNPSECKSKEFGIDDNDEYAKNEIRELNIDSITKYRSDPPTWAVQLCNKEIICDTNTLFTYSKFKILIANTINRMPLIKQATWQDFVGNYTASGNFIEVDAPKEADDVYPIIEALHDFTSAGIGVTNLSNIDYGPTTIKVKSKYSDLMVDVIAFKRKHFIEHLTRTKVVYDKNANMFWAKLRPYLGSTRVKADGRSEYSRVWYRELPKGEELPIPEYERPLHLDFGPDVEDF